MTSSSNSTDAHFAAEGGIKIAPYREEDPYRALDELMAVVEALCPAWPQRDVFDQGASMRL